jgi:hypothetical protein
MYKYFLVLSALYYTSIAQAVDNHELILKAFNGETIEVKNSKAFDEQLKVLGTGQVNVSIKKLKDINQECARFQQTISKAIRDLEPYTVQLEFNYCKDGSPPDEDSND